MCTMFHIRIILFFMCSNFSLVKVFFFNAVGEEQRDIHCILALNIIYNLFYILILLLVFFVCVLILVWLKFNIKAVGVI